MQQAIRLVGLATLLAAAGCQASNPVWSSGGLPRFELAALTSGATTGSNTAAPQDFSWNLACDISVQPTQAAKAQGLHWITLEYGPSGDNLELVVRGGEGTTGTHTFTLGYLDTAGNTWRETLTLQAGITRKVITIGPYDADTGTAFEVSVDTNNPHPVTPAGSFDPTGKALVRAATPSDEVAQLITRYKGQVVTFLVWS